jgi:dUTP pyrophosphatase
MNLKIQIIDTNLNSALPVYATEHASGLDIASASIEQVILGPMETKLIPTNLRVEIPVGFEGQIRPRSGLAIKHNIGIMNSPGTIDADYRGELKILLTNFGKNSYTVNFCERIAQLVICKVERVSIEVEKALSETKRDEGGFGHTGIK